MELAGEQQILAPRQKVWDLLNDPDMLLKCIPGCEELKKIDTNEMQARLLAKVGPVRARFTGKVRITDQLPPNSYTLHFEGSGGAAGIASGQSVVTLKEDGENTRLHYTVQASVGGKLGQVGGRLIDASAKKMAAEFFRTFNENVERSDEASVPTPVATAPTEADVQPKPDDAPVPALTTTPADVAVPVTSSTTTSKWGAELQRLLWLGIGIALGAALTHLWHV